MLRKYVPMLQRRKQSGGAIIEFALTAFVFFTLLLGIIDFSRLMFAWNSAVEATRWGARLAVVCDLNDAQIKQRMRQILLGQIPDDNDVDIAYIPAGCNKATCEMVRVSINFANSSPVQMLSPFTGFLSMLLPPMQTSLPRESMESMHVESDGITNSSNPVCLP